MKKKLNKTQRLEKKIEELEKQVADLNRKVGYLEQQELFRQPIGPCSPWIQPYIPPVSPWIQPLIPPQWPNTPDIICKSQLGASTLTPDYSFQTSVTVTN